MDAKSELCETSANFSSETLQSAAFCERENHIVMEDLPTRWEVELEFVQSLANIQYLSYLAQNEYLQKPEFLAYLEYLNYWRRPEYARYVVYSNCLHILTLLQTKEFRDNIVKPEFINMLMNDMVKRWQDPDDVTFTLPLENGEKSEKSEKEKVE